MKSVRAYKYRWLILVALMFLTLSVELHWLALAPVVRAAGVFYQGQFNPASFFNIDFLALVYMIVFVLVSIPASYIINRFGIVVSLRIAAGMVLIGSLGKWFVSADFRAVVGFQILLAFAQPLILNSVTTVGTRWFPLRDRGFAIGLVSFSQYLALGLVMIFSPLMVGTNYGTNDYGTGIDRLMMVYGIGCSVMALLGGLLIKEKPPTPASFEPAEPTAFSKSYKSMFRNPSFVGLMIVFSLGWAHFITLLVKVDSVSALTGFQNSNAIVGVVMLCGGMLGALLIPGLSDRYRKRKLFLVVCGIGAIPAGVLLTFSSSLSFWVFTSQTITLIGASLLGFFLMGAGPLGYQYAAELSHPVAETVSQGLLSLNSEFLGVFLVLFTTLQGGAYLRIELLIMLVFGVVGVFILMRLKESPVIITEDERLQEAVKKEIVHLM